MGHLTIIGELGLGNLKQVLACREDVRNRIEEANRADELQRHKDMDVMNIEAKLVDALTSGSEELLTSCIKEGTRIGASKRKMKAAREALKRLASAREAEMKAVAELEVSRAVACDLSELLQAEESLSCSKLKNALIRAENANVEGLVL
eukprot:2875993-Pleurochrysis_carterae.AAC.1